VLVGINLPREGLDLPEVSLVAILDADKEGFLRSTRSLIQTIGRAARNVSGEVHMYADNITESMREAIDETERRRAKQVAYNEANGIDPKPLRKKIADILDQVYREADDIEIEVQAATVFIRAEARTLAAARSSLNERPASWSRHNATPAITQWAAAECGSKSSAWDADSRARSHAAEGC